MEPEERASVQRRRSTMLRLMLEENDLVDEEYVPRWGEGDDFATLLNPPEDSTSVLALFNKIDEADMAARRVAPTIPTETPPGPDDMRAILIRLVQAQELSAAQSRNRSRISQK